MNGYTKQKGGTKLKRSIYKLTVDELRKVFFANSKLRSDVLDDFENNEMCWISEYLDCFRKSLSDWSIGFSGYDKNFICVRDDESFLEGLLKAQRDYGFLEDKYTPIIVETLQQLRYAGEYNGEISNEEYERIALEVETNIKTLEDAVIEEFDSLTEKPSDERLLEYFIEFYIDSRMEGNFYILDDSFVLYESREISYQ